MRGRERGNEHGVSVSYADQTLSDNILHADRARPRRGAGRTSGVWRTGQPVAVTLACGGSPDVEAAVGAARAALVDPDRRHERGARATPGHGRRIVMEGAHPHRITEFRAMRRSRGMAERGSSRAAVRPRARGWSITVRRCTLWALVCFASRPVRPGSSVAHAAMSCSQSSIRADGTRQAYFRESALSYADKT